MSEATIKSFQEKITGKWGLKDQFGSVVKKAIFDQIIVNSESFTVKRDHKFGLIDKKTGRTLVECKYNSIGKFKDGYAVVCTAGLLARIMPKKGCFGIIDEKGKEVYTSDHTKKDTEQRLTSLTKALTHEMEPTEAAAPAVEETAVSAEELVEEPLALAEEEMLAGVEVEADIEEAVPVAEIEAVAAEETETTTEEPAEEPIAEPVE